MISKELTIELQRIIKTEYGIDLSFAEAVRIGNDLVESFDIFARIDFEVKVGNKKTPKR